MIPIILNMCSDWWGQNLCQVWNPTQWPRIYTGGKLQNFFKCKSPLLWHFRSKVFNFRSQTWMPQQHLATWRCKSMTACFVRTARSSSKHCSSFPQNVKHHQRSKQKLPPGGPSCPQHNWNSGLERGWATPCRPSSAGASVVRSFRDCNVSRYLQDFKLENLRVFYSLA